MTNPVLESLRAQRAEQISTMDAILDQVDERDLVDAERGLLEASRARIQLIDQQIEPLAAFEALRATHDGTVAGLPAPAQTAGRRLDVAERPPLYRTAGEYVVDYLASRGIGRDGRPDEAAAARVYQARVIADQKTSDTPGLLPTPIVGGVVNLIDANRPLITSLGGAKPMGGIPGTSFGRPKIVTHTAVGKQATQKTQLASQAMSITSVAFTKETHGGTVDISRQDIDWTSPSAWDILVRDLADVYAVETETTVSAAFHAAVASTPVVVATNDLKGWTLALYTAAMHSYQAGGRMPDRIWCSLDVWAALGALVDVARPVFHANEGASSLSAFSGDVLGLPRVVVPTFAAGTAVVGNSAFYEVYEEMIGLLSVIEPSILGVQVAYGGYLAYGALHGAALVPLTAPAGMPTLAEMSEDAMSERGGVVVDVDDKAGNGGKAGK